jgi:hypothetical protein
MKKPFFGTKSFDLVTLILNFGLVLKNFNLDYIFWTKCVKSSDKWDIHALWRDLSFDAKTFHFETLNFDLVLKSINLGYIFWTKMC